MRFPLFSLTLATILAGSVPVLAEPPQGAGGGEPAVEIIEIPSADEPADAVEAEPTGFPSGSARPRVGVGGVLAFGGEADVEILGNRLHADLDTTRGLGADFTFPVLPFLAIGGEARMLWWLSEPDDDAGIGRHLLIEIAPFVKGGYPFGTESMWGMVYARVPIGISFSSLNDDFETANGVETSSGLGWNLALYGGAEAFFGRIGMRAEVGYQYHAFSNELESGGRKADLDVSFAQITIELQAVVLL